MDIVLIILGLVSLIAVMLWAVHAAKSSRAASARKNKAGLILLSSLMFGVGSMTDEPPPRAEDVRNKNEEKKSESSGSKTETD